MWHLYNYKIKICLGILYLDENNLVAVTKANFKLL